MADNNPIDDALERYRTTQQQMLAASGGVGTTMAAAYSSVQAGYMTPNQAAMAGALPGYPSGMMTPTFVSSFRAPTPAPPPPVFAHPGMTSQFADAYEMSLMASRAAAAPMMDPANAATAFGRRSVNRFGAQWGGAIGAGIGAVGGGVGGASLGYSLGDFVGSALGNIPVVGDILSWTTGQVHREAAMQLSQGLSLQYGTMGQINMGQRDTGLGGRGMSTQAATSLAGRFRNFAEQSGGKSFNANDLVNVTSAAAESGLLAGAGNTDQIFEQIKKVMGLVGQVARLTGDPDFRANVRAMGDMVRSGVSLQDIPQVMSSMNNYARMAGMTRGQAGVYGQQGASIFAQAGLTTGLGQQVGVHSAAMGNLTQGIFDPTTANLLGGREGITQRFTESSAAFLSGAGNMLLPFLAQQGEGGKLGINQDKLKQLMSGDINLSSVIGQGAANMSDPGMQRKLLINRQRLLSELGQQAGPMGIQGLQLNLAMGLTEQGMDFETAAVTVAGGDVMQGSMLHTAWTDPKFQDRWRARLGESRQRTRFQGRQQAAARREAEPGWISRALEREVAPHFRVPGAQQLGTWWGGVQNRKAREEAQQIQEENDARIGIKRVYGPNWGISKEEQEIASSMTGDRPWESAPGQIETEATIRATVGDNPLAGAAQWVQSARYSDSPVMRGMFLIGQAKSGMAPPPPGAIRSVSKRISESGKGLSRAQGMSSEEWLRGMRTVSKNLSPEQMKLVKRVSLRIASQKGKHGEAVVIDDVLNQVQQEMVEAAGDELVFEANVGQIRSLIETYLARSSDSNVRIAVAATLDSAGVLQESYNVKDAQKAMGRETALYGKALNDYGLSATDEVSPEEQARVTAFLGGDADIRAGAVLAARDEAAFLKWAETAGDDKARAALELQKRSGAVAGQLGGYLAKKGLTSAQEIGSAISQGLRGQGPAAGLGHRARMEYIQQRAGTSLLDAGQGGAMDPQTQRQLENLNREEQVLARFADASDRFGRAVTGLEDAVRAATPKPAMPPKPDE